MWIKTEKHASGATFDLSSGISELSGDLLGWLTRNLSKLSSKDYVAPVDKFEFKELEQDEAEIRLQAGAASASELAGACSPEADKQQAPETGKPASWQLAEAREENPNSGCRNHELGLIAGRFEIINLLGSGGMSEVFKARDLSSGNLVAVKKILPDRLRDDKSLERFEQEAQVIERLDHRNISKLKEFGKDKDGLPYFVMEYVEGINLCELLKQEGALDPDRALNLVSQVADALSHAHAAGVIHRDIKPSNILLTRTTDGKDRIQIVDFGIARVFDHLSSAHMPLTETSEMLGTPWYMSPEQCFGKVADARSDIYQIGCVFYELLSDKRAFEGNTAFEVMFGHVTALPSLDDLDAEIQYIVAKALQKNPDERYQSVADFKTALAELQAHRALRGAAGAALERKNKNQSLSKLFIRRTQAAALDAILLGIISSFVTFGLCQSGIIDTSSFVWDPVPSSIMLSGLAFCLGALSSITMLPALLIALWGQNYGLGPNAFYSFLMELPFAQYLWVENLPVVPFIAIACAFLYSAGFEGSKLRATPGKILFGLKIQSADPRQLPLWQSSCRALSKIITFLFLPGIVRFFSALLIKKRSAKEQIVQQLRFPLHDCISNSVIMLSDDFRKRRSPIAAVVSTIIAAFTFFTLPWLCCQTGNYDLAIFLNPQSSTAYEMRADAGVLSRDFKKAAADYTKAESLNPQRVLLYQKHASALYLGGDLEGVHKLCKAAIRACKYEERDHFIKIQALTLAYGEGKYQEAMDKAREMPAYKQNKLFLAELSKHLGNPELSRKEFEILDRAYEEQTDRSLHPPAGWEKSAHANPAAFLSRALALNELGQSEYALFMVDRAIEDCAVLLKSSETRHSSWIMQIEGASRLLRAKMTLKTENALARKDLEAAVKAYSRYLELEKNLATMDLDYVITYGRMLNKRAETYSLLGEVDKAKYDRQAAAKMHVRMDDSGAHSYWSVY